MPRMPLRRHAISKSAFLSPNIGMSRPPNRPRPPRQPACLNSSTRSAPRRSPRPERLHRREPDMIIDIHCHSTPEPQALHLFRDKQLAGLADPARRPAKTDLASLNISDEALIQSVQPQLKLQRERGSDLTVFSPRAAGMAHHVGTEQVSQQWARMSNDLIHRLCTLLPDNFAGVGQLPQFPGVSPKNCL